ncbi:MAG: HD domain-containing phosphohydrolase [Nitrospirota bacterium]
MSEQADKEKIPFVIEVRKKIRLLNSIAAFIVVTLLAVIMRYLYKPASEFMDFLPDVSVTLIVVIVLVLTAIGFYLWRVVSRQILHSIERYRNRLNSILHITRELREETYSDIILDKIMEYSLAMTNSDAGAILMVESDSLVFKIVKGARSGELIEKSISKGEGIAGWVAEKGMPVRLANARKDDRYNPAVDAITGYETRSVLAVPFRIRSGVIGVIELLNKKSGTYSSRDEEMITYLADQAAVSIGKAKFYEDQKNYEIHVTDILLEAIDFQIPEKTGHSKRVAKYCSIMAKAINMSEEDQKRLYFAGLLHDVGFLKIRADENYQGEYYIRHPVIGYEMIRPINFYADIAPLILYHHERYDGSGYPKGLKGEAIPLEARIIAIAEAFDAMISEESYKIPLSFDDAIKELSRNAGTQFDFWLVEVFVNNISPEHLE